MEFVRVILCNTAIVLNVLLLLQLLFGINICKTKNQYVMIGAIFIVFNTVLSIIFRENAWIQTAAIYIYMVASAFIVTKQNFFKIAFFAVVAILLDVQCGSILELAGKLLGLDVYTVVVEEEVVTVTSYCADYIVLFILVILLNVTKKKNKQIQLKMGEAVFLCFFCIFSPAIIIIFELLEDTIQEISYSLSWMIFVIVLNVAVFYGIIYRNHAKYYKELSENYREQFSLEYEYFKDYKKKQKDMVKFRHDYRNHMLLLESMLEKGEYEKAKDYFYQLSERGEKMGKKILTGNEIVDMLLSAKQEQFEQNHIKIRCNGGLEPLVFLEDVDCCILFSNLLDNAIEANSKCEKERHITIKSSQKQSMYMLEVSNRMEGQLEKEGNFLKTTKEDKIKHGIGTRNIFEVIEKYHGEYKFFTRENDFVIQVVFVIS